MFIYSLSTANPLKSSIFTPSNARSFVALRTTFGTLRVERFFPPIHTQTPFTSVCEAGLTEVVTPRGAEVEELVGYDGWVA
jgi:hypothetical protein